MLKQKKKILLDLDGVLNTYTNDFEPCYIPPARDDTLDFVKQLSQNYEIKLFTTRDKFLASIWLIENHLDDYIKDITNEKEVAWLIVDVRCIRFNGHYDELLRDIDNFKVWHKS